MSVLQSDSVRERERSIDYRFETQIHYKKPKLKAMTNCHSWDPKVTHAQVPASTTRTTAKLQNFLPTR
jgi:hypothetical protein